MKILIHLFVHILVASVSMQVREPSIPRGATKILTLEDEKMEIRVKVGDTLSFIFPPVQAGPGFNWQPTARYTWATDGPAAEVYKEVTPLEFQKLNLQLIEDDLTHGMIKIRILKSDRYLFSFSPRLMQSATVSAYRPKFHFYISSK